MSVPVIGQALVKLYKVMTLNGYYCVKFCFAVLFCFMFGAVKPGFRSVVTPKLVVNVVGKL